MYESLFKADDKGNMYKSEYVSIMNLFEFIQNLNVRLYGVKDLSKKVLFSAFGGTFPIS